MSAILDILSEKTPDLSVGVLSARLMALAEDLSLLSENGVRLAHFDIMDGHFVPNSRWGHRLSRQ